MLIIMAYTPSPSIKLQVPRGPCLDELITFETCYKDIALVWDRGDGIPASWTYGEVQAYAFGLSRKLSQLCVGREEGRGDGSVGSRTDTSNAVVRPLPYIGVYAESSPELPAVVLG